MDDIELLLLDVLKPEASCEDLLALAESEFEASFEEAKLLEEAFWFAVLAARLAFAAELSAALAFSDLLDALELLADLSELEPVEKLSPAVREALPANEPLAAELLLAALFAAELDAALADLALFLVEPEPCQEPLLAL